MVVLKLKFTKGEFFPITVLLFFSLAFFLPTKPAYTVHPVGGLISAQRNVAGC
jgi:hypothetical protein